MVSSTNKKDTKEDILHVFNLFDTDGSGQITLEDLRRVADELGEDISDDELRNMIARADTCVGAAPDSSCGGTDASRGAAT